MYLLRLVVFACCLVVVSLGAKKGSLKKNERWNLRVMKQSRVRLLEALRLGLGVEFANDCALLKLKMLKRTDQLDRNISPSTKT